MVYGDRVSSHDSDGVHLAIDLSLDDVLHFHGFNHDQCLSINHCVTWLDTHRHDSSRHWRENRLGEVNFDWLGHVLLILELLLLEDGHIHVVAFVIEAVLDIVILTVVELQILAVPINIQVYQGAILKVKVTHSVACRGASGLVGY